MTNWIDDIARAANGRPFTADEAERIADHAESLGERVLAAKALEDGQRLAARGVADALGDRAEQWGLPREPFAQDFARLLTGVACAALLGSPDPLGPAVVEPLTGLAAALDVPPGEFADLFAAAWQPVRKRLTPGQAALLDPLFAHAADALRAAEPHAVLVG